MTEARNIKWHEGAISLEDREHRLGQKSAVLWFTGLSGAGKSTLARAVEARLFQDGYSPVVLDGDNVRHGLCSDLGFSPDERAENIRRIAHLAELVRQCGHLVMAAFISPYRAERDLARSLVPEGRFLEIYVQASVDACAERDPKGLYARALRGEIPEFTGVSAPYEEPLAPELVLDTTRVDVEEGARRVVGVLEARGLLPGRGALGA